METTEEIVGYLREWCRDRIRYSLLEDDDARALVSERITGILDSTAPGAKNF